MVKAECAVIGRVDLGFSGTDIVVETPFGPIEGLISNVSGKEVFFVSRHGKESLPPHKVNYRALISCISLLGINRIISLNTVGSMRHPVGSFFIPTDFIEFTKQRINTFFEERAVHIEMGEPYCPIIRAALCKALTEHGYEPFNGVYVCTEGPHLESPAQIRMLKGFGDVVGMTGYPEVVLARELCMCYASLCLVTNPACGVEAGTLSAQDVTVVVEKMTSSVAAIISHALSSLPPGERSCSCRHALVNAEL